MIVKKTWFLIEATKQPRSLNLLKEFIRRKMGLKLLAFVFLSSYPDWTQERHNCNVALTSLMKYPN